MSVKYFLMLAGTAGILTAVVGVGVRMMQPSGKSNGAAESGGAMDHHDNAKLLGEDQEEIEVARKAPLTSDKGAEDASLRSDEVRRLLDGNASSALRGSGISNRDD